MWGRSRLARLYWTGLDTARLARVIVITTSIAAITAILITRGGLGKERAAKLQSEGAWIHLGFDSEFFRPR